MITLKKRANQFTELNFFKPDRRNGKGFDMDLVSIDTVYHYLNNPNAVTYASRDWSIRGGKISLILQAIFGRRIK